ncbi:MAG: YkgJ family cysteine cluster protein [Dehalobacterium sp.]
MKIKIFLAHFDDAIGYDLEILHEDATIQDYLDELNQFQEKHVAACKGCDGCCFERIPLTSLDVIKYLKDPQLINKIGYIKPPLTAFIHNYCHVAGTGPVIDISLKRNPDQSCIFLDQEQKICRNHISRSFVCQSFVCLPHSEKAGQLRDTLLNVGEDDLVHRYLLEAKEKEEAPVINENNNASPSLEDYPGNIFSGKEHYQEIKIKDTVPETLWQQLTKATPVD